MTYEGKYKSEYSDSKDFKSANYLVVSGTRFKK